jgi:hypothetical protein
MESATRRCRASGPRYSPWVERPRLSRYAERASERRAASSRYLSKLLRGQQGSFRLRANLAKAVSRAVETSSPKGEKRPASHSAFPRERARSDRHMGSDRDCSRLTGHPKQSKCLAGHLRHCESGEGFCYRLLVLHSLTHVSVGRTGRTGCTSFI